MVPDDRLLRDAARLLRCTRCRAPLPMPMQPHEDLDRERACPACGAPLAVAPFGIDVVPDRAPERSWAVRAMQSDWLSRVYEAIWRPVAFGLSTGFGAPGAAAEIDFVCARLTGRSGPWLDLSCGPGILTRALLACAGARAVVGVDLSRAMLERAHVAAPGALLVRADAEALPFADGTFGAVANLAALDLYDDAARVIAESARVLGQGGLWIASTFVSRAAKRSRWTRSRKPTERELASAAARAGLERFCVRRFRRYLIAWADKG